MQAVIFLFEHSEEGSAGFILNRPTELTLGKLLAADALLPEFSDNLLYLGGDVGSDAMHFMHGCPDIQVWFMQKALRVKQWLLSYCGY